MTTRSRSIVPGSATVVEGDAGATSLQIPVQLSAPSGRVVHRGLGGRRRRSAGWATAPDDFSAGSGTLTFAAGPDDRHRDRRGQR